MFRYLMPLVAALAIIPLQAQTASTHNNQTQSNLQQASVQHPMSSDARLKVSNDVSSVLNDTNEAREAIAANNKAEALNDVNDALYALRQAKTIAPNERLVPLYTETDSYSVLGPIVASRNTTTNSMNQPGQTVPSSQVNANPKSAGNQTGNPNNLTVQRAYGEYTHVVLDTQLAQTHLSTARQALEQNSLSKADAGLKATQDAVILTSTEGDMPLLRARENLTLARSSANSGDYQETQLALEAAGRALDNYAKTSRHHATDAKNLAAEIAIYDKNTSQHASELSTKINGWWTQTTDWIDSGNSIQSASLRTP